MYRGQTVLLLLVVSSFLWAEDPCVSGVPVGERPGPYTFIVSTGKERGQLTCYICETADQPAVVIFARSLSNELGELAAALDRAVADPKNTPLRGWITFLYDDHLKIDRQIIEWGKTHAIRTMPLGVFEDSDGPPSYRLAPEADVTVLLFTKKRVVANFAFRAGELTSSRRREVLAALPKILDAK